jgi:hypothetical protein
MKLCNIRYNNKIKKDNNEKSVDFININNLGRM